MPDRFIKTIAGIHGGALVIVGLGYIATALAWIFAPSYTREIGLEWISVGWISQDSVGLLWLLTGLIALATGWFSRGHKKLETFGYAAAIFTPILVVSWFMGAVLLGNLTMLSLIIVQIVWPTVLIWWIGSRADTSTQTEVGVKLKQEGDSK